MTDSVTVDGTDYDLTSNPSLGTVREVQSMQMGIITDHVSEEKLQQMDSLEDESEIVQAIIDEGGYTAFQNVMFERSMLEPIQTISLACDHPFEPEDFDEMGAQDFKELREDAEDELDGNASDFFNALGLGMSLNEAEMERRAQAATSET